jgi:two-component system response regulator AtoC
MDESPDLVATTPAGTLSPARRRTLLVVRGDDVDVRPLPTAGEVVVGRGTACDVRIDHPSISRLHLRLRLAADAIHVVDQGGANGTLLRGARLPASQAVAISANDALHVGDVVLIVQEVAAGPAAGAPMSSRPSGELAASPTAPVVLDPAMRRLYDLAARIARGTIGVLIVGETGAGKEVLAEFVHRSSPRAAGPLVRINCAALPDSLVESELFGHERGAFTGAQRERRGLLETADGGTVLLDEVGELAPTIQAKLLRVLEERRVLRVGASEPRPLDVRFVAATNRDLEADVAAGRFRRDLYFRLAGVVLTIPPLRDRPLEIDALARVFAAEAAAGLDRPPPRLSDAAVRVLRAHPWTGNARELRNAIERAVLLTEGDVLEPEALTLGQPAAASEATLAGELAALERQRILAALDECGGNQTLAAARVGMPRRTFVKRLEDYGIARPRKK